MQQPQRRVSPEEYLLLDNNSKDVRYEYLDGQPRMMPGGTGYHARIAGRLFVQISLTLGDEMPCQPYIADRRTKLANNRYVYPDIVVSCNVADHGSSTTLEEPRLIIEVLSPDSTEYHDRTRKLRAYQETSSVQEIALVSQNVQRIEVFRRSEEHSEHWLYQQYQPGDLIIFECLDIEISVDAIYKGIAIPIEIDEEDESK